MSMSITYNGNTIKSIGRTTDYETTPDDRQELVKTIGGVVVEDYGYVANGEIITLSATFSNSDYNTLVGYWQNRTKVNIVFDDGGTLSNARIVLRKTSYYDSVLPQYKKVNLEIWKI